MSTSTSPASQLITAVQIDTERAAPLALKYPNGLLMPTAYVELLGLIRAAAAETHTRIFIVRGARLKVYHTADGEFASVPEKDPLDFFTTLWRMQADAMTSKGKQI